MWFWQCWEDEEKEREIILGGWNNQKDTSDTYHNHGPVEDMLSEKDTIPDGGNSKKEDSYN